MPKKTCFFELKKLNMHECMLYSSQKIWKNVKLLFWGVKSENMTYSCNECNLQKLKNMNVLRLEKLRKHEFMFFFASWKAWIYCFRKLKIKELTTFIASQFWKTCRLNLFQKYVSTRGVLLWVTYRNLRN